MYTRNISLQKMLSSYSEQIATTTKVIKNIMKHTLYYVTSNDSKFEEANFVLGPSSSCHPHYILKQQSLDLDELQGDPEAIILHKTKQAFELAKNFPVIVDDVSLHIDALNGFPGPYIRSFLEHLGIHGIWELMSHYPNKSCHAVCRIGYMSHINEGPHIFSGTIYGNICPPKEGASKNKKSWNPIFQPHGMTESLADCKEEERLKISHRTIALEKLKEFLLQKK